MRLLGCFLLATVGALAQAGAPIFSHAGPLACGLRLYQPGQVQEWCFYSTPPAPPKIICNAIHVITPAVAGDTPPVAASQSCFATVIDQAAVAAGTVPNGTINQVTWLVWQPIVALPPNSTGTIQYQVASSIMPCAVNPSGACVQMPGQTTATILQNTEFRQGSFSSGIAVAGVMQYDVEGQPSTLVDVEPQAQYSLAAAPGFAVVSTTGIAEAVTPYGLCSVSSPDPGTAQFGLVGGQLRVGWLPDGWCPAGLGANPTGLYGSCSSMQLTVEVGRDAVGPRCSAVPTEDVVALTTAIMSWWSAAPTIQGR